MKNKPLYLIIGATVLSIGGVAFYLNSKQPMEKPIEFEPIESEPIEPYIEPEDNIWSEWGSCVDEMQKPVYCDGGKRRRICLTKNCVGPSLMDCNTEPCSEHYLKHEGWKIDEGVKVQSDRPWFKNIPLSKCIEACNGKPDCVGIEYNRSDGDFLQQVMDGSCRLHKYMHPTRFERKEKSFLIGRKEPIEKTPTSDEVLPDPVETDPNPYAGVWSDYGPCVKSDSSASMYGEGEQLKFYLGNEAKVRKIARPCLKDGFTSTHGIKTDANMIRDWEQISLGDCRKKCNDIWNCNGYVYYLPAQYPNLNDRLTKGRCRLHSNVRENVHKYPNMLLGEKYNGPQ